MIIESQGFYISGISLYERLRISQLPQGGQLSIAAPAETTRLPATLLGNPHYQGAETSVYVKTPYLFSEPTERYEIVATPADGGEPQRQAHAVNFSAARKRSRSAFYLNHRAFKQAIAEASALESASGNPCRIKIIKLIGSPTHVICRSRIIVPHDGETHDIRISCLNGNLEPIGEKPIRMGESVVPTRVAPSVTDFSHGFSVRLPWNQDAVHIVAWDATRPGCCVVASLDRKQTDAMVAKTESEFMNCGLDPYYHEWFAKHRATPLELERQRACRLPVEPTFSIVVPLYKTPEGFFRDMLASVTNQTYGKWELILVNASPEIERLGQLVEEACTADSRVKSISLEKNLGISLNTNAGIELATGDFVCFFDHDDTLEPDLLFEYAKAISEHDDIDLLYCDEDKLDETGKLRDPFFKPDFNIDHLRSNNYICHLLTVRRSLLETLAPNTPEFDGAQDHNMTLQASEKARRIWHVPHVLYHWRISSTSTASGAGAKDYANEAGIRAVSSHLKRLGIRATVERSDIPFNYRVTYLPPEDAPLVSVIIPSSDHTDVLATCIDSILEKTTYPNYEVVVVDNNSHDPKTFVYYKQLGVKHADRVRVVTWPGEFNFSKIVNFGVAEAKGDYLLLLNNDTEVITPEWMERMLGICAREDVGAVGVRLFYPDETIQHAGVVVTDRDAGHLFHDMPRNSSWGYFNFADEQRDLTAVTAACMMTKRSAFEKVGGFTERFSVAFNDVDFCLKLGKAGLLVVYTPYVELYHYESLSRGTDLTHEAKVRNYQERSDLFSTWHEYYTTADPNFTPNLRETITMSVYYHF